MDSYKTCDKCFEPFDQEENKPYSIVPCGHEFCLSCIDNIDNNECPTCSGEIEHKIINWGLLKVIQALETNYDVFISYQWETKEHVLALYKTLTTEYNLKVWVDEHQIGSSRLTSELAKAISNSKVFLCCVTQKYSESRNCIHEINWAYNRKKDFIVLMFERLNLEDIPDVGFLIDPFVRHNLYKYPEILENWSGEKFEPIINAIIDVVEPNARRRSYFSMNSIDKKCESLSLNEPEEEVEDNISRIIVNRKDSQRTLNEEEKQEEEGGEDGNVDEDEVEENDEENEEDGAGEENEEDDGEQKKKKKSRFKRLFRIKD